MDTSSYKRSEDIIRDMLAVDRHRQRGPVIEGVVPKQPPTWMMNDGQFVPWEATYIRDEDGSISLEQIANAAPIADDEKKMLEMILNGLPPLGVPRRGERNPEYAVTSQRVGVAGPPKVINALPSAVLQDLWDRTCGPAAVPDPLQRATVAQWMKPVPASPKKVSWSSDVPLPSEDEVEEALPRATETPVPETDYAATLKELENALHANRVHWLLFSSPGDPVPPGMMLDEEGHYASCAVDEDAITKGLLARARLRYNQVMEELLAQRAQLEIARQPRDTPTGHLHVRPEEWIAISSREDTKLTEIRHARRQVMEELLAQRAAPLDFAALYPGITKATVAMVIARQLLEMDEQLGDYNPVAREVVREARVASTTWSSMFSDHLVGDEFHRPLPLGRLTPLGPTRGTVILGSEGLDVGQAAAAARAAPSAALPIEASDAPATPSEMSSVIKMVKSSREMEG